jgi:hypothetical protein
MAKEVTPAKEGWEWRPLESKGKPAKELDYYDCPYSNDLEYEDFSKEFLIKLLRAGQKWYLSMALIWWAEVSKKIGQKEANELLPEVWETLAKSCMPLYYPLLGPNYKTADDFKTLEECMKAAHLPPDGGVDKGEWRGTLIWEDANHAVATVYYCYLLEYFESIGAEDTICALCQVAEPRGAEAYFTHPNIKVTGIKVPPRKNPGGPFDDINPCCIWDYRLTDKPQPRGVDREREERRT